MEKLFQHLRRKLTLIFALLTSSIVVSVFGVTCFFSIRQVTSNSMENFMRQKNAITAKLQTDRIIRNSWLSQTEISNQMILSIKDSGVPLFFPGAWLDSRLRSALTGQIQNLAAQGGFPEKQMAAASLSTDILESPVYTIYRSSREKLYGCMALIPSRYGDKELTILQYLPGDPRRIRNILLLFTAAGLFSVAALSVVSWYLVKKALKPVEENQRKQKEFISAASHELRSPLAVILASASALLNGPGDAPRFVPRIEKECGRMSFLISDMLTLAASDAKGIPIKTEPLDADTLLIDLYETYGSLAGEKNRKLLLELPDEVLPKIRADKNRFRQILSILLDNALVYAPELSVITLRAYPVKEGRRKLVCFEVEDHGAGIPDAQKEQVFERFYRADSSRSDKTHFGLGLSVAKELTLLHGGVITVLDTPGGGADFVVRIPSL